MIYTQSYVKLLLLLTSHCYKQMYKSDRGELSRAPHDLHHLFTLSLFYLSFPVSDVCLSSFQQFVNDVFVSEMCCFSVLLLLLSSQSVKITSQVLLFFVYVFLLSTAKVRHILKRARHHLQKMHFFLTICKRITII